VTFPDDFNLADYFLFDREREGMGQRTAIRFGDRAWTYRDVADRSRALARFLVAAGVRPEQRVYVVLPDVPPFAWSIFGILAAGGVLTMGNPVAPIDDLAYVVDYVRAAALITTPEVAAQLAPRLPDCVQTILLAPDAPTGADPEAAVEISGEVVRMGRQALSLDAAIQRGRELATPLPALHRDHPGRPADLRRARQVGGHSAQGTGCAHRGQRSAAKRRASGCTGRCRTAACLGAKRG